MPQKNKEPWLNNLFLGKGRPCAWIIFIGFLIYCQVLFFGFIDFDDKLLIVDNYKFLANLANILQAFKQNVFEVSLQANSRAYYRPLLTVSFMLNAKLAGTVPFLYHFFNICLHLLASCLLFLFLIKLKHRREPAFIFSLLFTIHPVLTQAVAWIPGRNDSLLAVFLLSAFIFFIDFFETKKIRYYLWHMLFFTLALFTKEAGIVLVLVCILYLHFITKERLFSWNERKFAIGWLVIVIFWFLLRKSALGSNAVEVTVFNAVGYLLPNLPIFIEYIGKAILPFKLSVLSTIKDISFGYGFTAAALMVVALLFSRRKRLNFIFFGLLWFIFFLLPSLVVPVFLGLEHRVYLSLVGLIIVLLEIDFIKDLGLKKRSVAIICILFISMFCVITLNHSRSFASPLSFWKNAATTSAHSSLAHLNLGANYYSGGLFDEAEAEYRKSLELNSCEPKAHNNLGVIYVRRNNPGKAEEEFKREIEVNPSYADSYFNLGLLYYNQGKIAQAQALWEKALEVNPDYLRAYNNLAILSYNQKNLEKAVFYVRELQKRNAFVQPELLKALGLASSQEK